MALQKKSSNNREKFIMEYKLKRTTPLTGESYADYAYRVLRKNIMEFVLPPGELLNEISISNELNISRTPVHEAVLRLRSEQLVDIIPRRESRVTCIDMELASEGIFLRCALEPMLMHSVAGTLSRDYISELQENLERQEAILKDQTDLYRFYPVDDDFHKLMYEAANKPHLHGAMRKTTSHLDRIRYLVRYEGGMDIEAKSFIEHKMMFKYLTLGIPPEADLTMLFKGHILRFQTNLEAYMLKYHDYFK